jgi:hypothetical protein
MKEKRSKIGNGAHVAASKSIGWDIGCLHPEYTKKN